MPHESTQEVSTNPADAGLRISITLRGKVVADSILMMVPSKEQLLSVIRNVVEGQIASIVEKL